MIKNLCDASDQVLLSTIPDDFDDPTHFNVQAPFYWIKKFAQYGFEPDSSYNANFLTPYSILFRKGFKLEHSHFHYLYGEKKLLDLYFSRITHERNLQVNQISDLWEDIKKKKLKIESLEITLAKSYKHIENLQNSLSIETTARQFYQEEIRKIQSSWFWRILLPVRVVDKIRRSLTPLFPKILEKSKV